MKDTFYFQHDYNVRNDFKIKKLLSKHGYWGYGLFWAIIEDLYNNTNVLQANYECIAFDLRAETPMIESIINDFDLFVIDGDKFGSLSVERRLNERNKKSQKAREAVLSRWSKLKDNTDVIHSYNDSNTIKERKGKENKGKEIKENISPTPKLSLKEKENNKEKEKDIDLIKRIINYLNLKAKKNFRYNSEANKRCIIARINEGYKPEDFKKVIDNKIIDWLEDPKMNEFLRPETLFSNKFEGYLNAEKTVIQNKSVPDRTKIQV